MIIIITECIIMIGSSFGAWEMDASSEALQVRGFDAVVAAVTIFNQAGRGLETPCAPPVAAKGRGRSRTPPGRLGEAEVVSQALEARCVGSEVSPPRFVHRDPCEAIRNLATHGRRRVVGSNVRQPFCPLVALRALEDAVTALRRDGVGV